MGSLAAAVIADALLKVYPGVPLATATLKTDAINADLLAFLRS